MRYQAMLIVLLGCFSFALAESLEDNLTVKESNQTQGKLTQTHHLLEDQAMEEQIQKALLGISTFSVLKEGTGKQVYLHELKSQTKKRKIKKSSKRKKHLRKKPKTESIDMDALPMAKTYPIE